MKETTINDLKELLTFNSELFEIYQELEDLDREGKSNTSLFAEKVLRVKQIINITDTIESRIASDGEELKKAIMFLDNELGLKFDPNEVENIMCFGATAEQMVPMRTVNGLNKRYSAIINVVDIYENAEVEYTDEMVEYAKKNSKYRRLYGALTSNNIDQMVLSKIKKEGLFEHDRLGECFYRIKYDMIYLNNDIEKEMIDHSYQIIEYPLILKGGVNRMFGISDEYAESFKSEIFDSVIAGNLEMLCKSDVEIAQDVFNGAEAMAYAYCVLSALILMDNEIEASKNIEKIRRVAEKINTSCSFIVVKNLLEIIVDDYEDTKNEFQFISIGGR